MNAEYINRMNSSFGQRGSQTVTAEQSSGTEFLDKIQQKSRALPEGKDLPVGLPPWYYENYEKIGGMPKDFYREIDFIKENLKKPGTGKKEKSWWQKRQERMKKLMAEQMEDARKKARQDSEMAQAYWQMSRMISQTRLEHFLKNDKEDTSSSSELFSPYGILAYEQIMDLILK